MEKTLLYAFVGALTPTLFWLLFFLKQDTYMPEPRRLILRTFLFGAASAFFALFFQIIFKLNFTFTFLSGIVVFVAMEELVKYLAVRISIIKHPANNERTDPVLYMICSALGFAAVENFFYIIDYLQNLQYLNSLLSGGYRFIGSTLLHAASSAIVGIFISAVFFQKLYIRRIFTILGLLFATLAHSFFNFLILSENPDYHKYAFIYTWFLIIILLVVFEILRRDKKIRLHNHK